MKALFPNDLHSAEYKSNRAPAQSKAKCKAEWRFQSPAEFECPGDWHQLEKKKHDMLHAWSCFRKLWTAVKNYSWSFRLIFRSKGFGGKSEKSVQALITTKHPPEGRGGDTWSMINDQVDRMGRGDKMWMKLMVWAFLGVTTISCRHFRFHLL